MNLLLGHSRVVLSGNYHCLQTLRLSIFPVLHRHLALAVGTKVGQSAVLSHFCQAAHQLVGHGDGVGHILLRLIGGIAEHHTLISRSDGVDLFVGHGVLLCLQSPVYTHGDIRRLLVNGGNHAAGIAVKSVFCPVISDFPDGLPDNFLNIHISLCGDLSHHQHQTGGHSSLAGHAAHGILLHQSVQNRVGDGITDLIRMAFRHRLGRKQ